MTSLTAAAKSNFDRYDPGAVIAAVNSLLPLGKEGALAAVEQHLASADRSADPQHGLFLVLRVLFDVPAAGHHPPLSIGIPESAEPADLDFLPHFPLVVVDDIPLLLITTFLIGGSAEPVEAKVKYYRENGVLRARPLTPPVPVDPAEILPRAAYHYRRAYGRDPQPSQLKMLEEQLQRMAANQ